jgi:hypothetical protein
MDSRLDALAQSEVGGGAGGRERAHRSQVRAGRVAAYHFKAKDPRAVDRDNAMRLLPPLKA